MTFLKVYNVSMNGSNGLIVNKISFTQKKNQRIAIAGETGSGKSTLLRMIAGLVHPDQGNIWFHGEQIDFRGTLIPGHREIAYLSQDFELPKFLRVHQVLEYARTRPAKESMKLYKVCRIDHLLNRKTDELSGGERQRIAIARILIAAPRLILLDEPYSNLDRVHKVLLKAVIEDIGSKLKISCILISHEPEDLLSWADTILIMKKGRLIQRGRPEKIYNYPFNAYVAGLLGKYSVIDKKVPHFSSFFGSSNQTRWFARPEHVRFGSPNNGVPGLVTKISYLGSHYDIDVLCGETFVTVRSTVVTYKVGDQVHVMVARP